ncbi:MAG: ABC transporter permease [Planctomycetes bacterium]|nr:ABC transporter permease [Planctomycetota bacterium]
MPRPAPRPGASPADACAAPWIHATPPGALALAARMLRWPAVLLARRDLLATLLRRDLEARVRGTALSWLWLLAQPLLLFAVYAFLFTAVLGLRVGGDGLPSATLAVSMFTGTLVWSSLAEALTRSATCLTERGHLLRCLRFPAELLPLEAALASCVTLALGALVYLACAALFGLWPLPSAALLALAPLLLLLQLVFSAGLGLLVASVNVLWRDTAPFLTAALTVWMFATPVFWIASPEVLPSVAPWMPWIEANPATALVEAWRHVLMGGEPALVHPRALGESLARLASWSAAAFALGSLVFFRLQRHLADEV